MDRYRVPERETQEHQSDGYRHAGAGLLLGGRPKSSPSCGDLGGCAGSLGVWRGFCEEARRGFRPQWTVSRLRLEKAVGCRLVDGSCRSCCESLAGLVCPGDAHLRRASLCFVFCSQGPLVQRLCFWVFLSPEEGAIGCTSWWLGRCRARGGFQGCVDLRPRELSPWGVTVKLP